MSYIYVRRARMKDPYEVGFYRQSNKDHTYMEFVLESEWQNREAAASRVNFLNGGQDKRWRE